MIKGAARFSFSDLCISSRLIERIADHACRICDNTVALEKAKLPQRLSKEIEELGDKSVEVFDQSVEAFFGVDVDELNAVIDTIEVNVDECDRLTEKVSKWGGEGDISLGYIIESIRRICSYARNIAEAAMNHLVDIG